MPRYAVTIAGVPAKAASGLLDDLRTQFSDGYVFRAPAARDYGAYKRANYTDNTVDQVLEAARDAVFGSTKRPSGFCHNITHECALFGKSKKTCKKEDSQSCFLQKPEYSIIFYQAGENEGMLLRRLHYAAYYDRIPETHYNKRERTREWIVGALKRARPTLAMISSKMATRFSPLLLPPDNFGGDKLKDLFMTIVGGDVHKKLEAFRREYYVVANASYAGRKGTVLFKPADVRIQHGCAGPQLRADLALSRQHRLGCNYPEGLHYDVTRTDGRDFRGELAFICRENGQVRPKGTHVNILIDDCIRP